MTDVEHRLLRAARELREIEIEPPPFEQLGGRRRPSGIVGRIPAVVMPMLFVVGGLALVAGGVDRQGDEPVSAPHVEVATETAGVAEPIAAQRPTGATLTARQEIALISSLRPTVTTSATPAPAPADVRTLSQRYR